MDTLAQGNLPAQLCVSPSVVLTICLSTYLFKNLPVCLTELQLGHWDAADEVHRSLMVDHVTEVSQWMVGVKRLIAETRKLSPELLEPLQRPAKPVQDPVEQVEDPDSHS